MKTMSETPPDMPPDQEFPLDVPRFLIGQLVRHRRYGYRGVVVDFDIRCIASDDWYEANQTQPDRDQPWYHVLVDGSTYVTYAAEENLLADDTDQPIHHPLVPHLFAAFDGQRYRRNDTPWPGWDGADSPPNHHTD